MVQVDRSWRRILRGGRIDDTELLQRHLASRELLTRARQGQIVFVPHGEVVAELAAGMAEMSEQNEGLFRVLVGYPITSADLRAIVLTGRRRLVAYYNEAIAGFLQHLPEQRRDMMVGFSYHIVASAIVSKSRGDDPTLIEISWSDLAQEVTKAATGYLEGAG